MFLCLKCFRVIGAAIFPFAFILYPVPFMIFTDVIDELMQNYLFLEAFQMLTHCHCKPSYKCTVM